MKILMICGSPRRKNSTSQYLLQALAGKLKEDAEVVLCQMADPNIAENIEDSQAVIAAFPLYVDGIPAGFLEALKNAEAAIKQKRVSAKAYVIVNNGFYDAVQNEIAIHMFWKWCEKCGLEKGCALGVGAGEMVQMAPLGHGPSANLGRAVDRLAEDIRQGSSRETVYIEPNFPRFLYKMSGNITWKQKIRKNGLKVSDIKMKRYAD